MFHVLQQNAKIFYVFTVLNSLSLTKYAKLILAEKFGDKMFEFVCIWAIYLVKKLSTS